MASESGAPVKSVQSFPESVSLSDVSACEAAVNAALLRQLSAMLRGENIMNNEEGTELYHPLSPEADDAWSGIVELCKVVCRVATKTTSVA